MSEPRLPAPDDAGWTHVITPPTGWWSLPLRDLWRWRDLIFLFARRNIQTLYRQTVLGSLWHVVAPLMQAGIYTLAFSVIARIPTGEAPAPLFYLAGMVVWNFFINCVQAAQTCLLDNQYLFSKIYFPRLVVPVSGLLTRLYSFFIQLLVLLVVYALYAFHIPSLRPGPELLWMPLIVILLAFMGMGIGLTIAAVTVTYRDLNQLFILATQLWMFASPVFFPSSIVPERFRWIVEINPLSFPLETFRSGLFGATVDPGQGIASFLVGTVLLTLLGVLLFSRVEKTFIDTI